jgi:N-acyl-D-aspartate/D-glutamate deacylase
MPLPQVVEMLSARNAAHMGFSDRGVISEGMKADLNVIDYAGLSLRKPVIVRDLPAGGRRLLQRADGYLATFVNGVCVQEKGEITESRPGGLLRSH